MKELVEVLLSRSFASDELTGSKSKEARLIYSLPHRIEDLAVVSDFQCRYLHLWMKVTAGPLAMAFSSEGLVVVMSVLELLL